MNRFAILAAALALACSSNDDQPLAHAPWSELSLPRASDSNPDPNVVEISLSAQLADKQYPGAAPSRVWSYDGSVPGPLIEAKVGDNLIVHFTNELPEPTTIHWHGVRVPASMDGTLLMQSPIEPGASFDYSFTLKDAGLFWFHPHMRSDVQVEKGLYGTLLVRGAEQPEVDAETVIVLDDVRVLPDGSFPEFLDDESKMMGREGNVLLVNGRSEPEVALRAGSLQRLRLVNSANGRFFNLRLEGHTLRVIGTDGSYYAKPWDTEQLLISPGERYDVLVIPTGAPGALLTLWNDPYARGHDSGSEPPMPLATIRLTDQSPLEGRTLPSAFSEIERLPAGPVDFPLVLSEGFDASGQLVFMINGQTFPNLPPLSVANGSLEVLEVRNESMMDHPFHLHGFFFQLLSMDGIGVETPVNKDTQIVRAGSALQLVSRFDEPGRFLFHCHILEHAEGGMAGEVLVE